MTRATTSAPATVPASTPPFTPEMARGMSEATLQRNILSLATVSLDWLAYHTHDSRRSQPGFPDLVLVSNTQKRLIFAELKTERGRQSIEQKQWERHLREAGHGEYYLWRPTHWLSGEIGSILQRRPAERHCRVCRCAEDNACEFGDGTCSWVGQDENTLEADLCTACAWVIARDAIASGLYQLQATNGDTLVEARGGLIPQPNLTEAEIDALQPIIDDIEAAGRNLDRIAEVAAKHGIEIPRRLV